MRKITPFLWFDGQAEEAARFYVSTFKNSKLGTVTRQSATFTLDGREYIAFNGGPHFKFTEAISLLVDCKTQKEIDRLWQRLSKGGEKQRCGWLKDRFGLSWQIVPSGLGKLLQSNRAMEAMLGMDKLDIKRLQKAAAADAPARRR